MIDIKKDNDFIKELLNRHEGETLDFKQSVNKPYRIARTMIGLANAQGRPDRSGISDQKKITGIDGEEEILYDRKGKQGILFASH
jgi:predicted HTH transcriptional regulator